MNWSRRFLSSSAGGVALHLLRVLSLLRSFLSSCTAATEKSDSVNGHWMTKVSATRFTLRHWARPDLSTCDERGSRKNTHNCNRPPPSVCGSTITSRASTPTSASGCSSSSCGSRSSGRSNSSNNKKYL